MYISWMDFPSVLISNSILTRPRIDAASQPGAYVCVTIGLRIAAQEIQTTQRHVCNQWIALGKCDALFGQGPRER
jgi:hypothetical protein